MGDFDHLEGHNPAAEEEALKPDDKKEKESEPKPEPPKHEPPKSPSGGDKH